jgi:hypothetical protein
MSFLILKIAIEYLLIAASVISNFNLLWAGYQASINNGRAGKIFDFHYEPFDDIKVPASIAVKFKILRKTIYLEGICNSCVGKSRHNPLAMGNGDRK